MAKAAMIVSAWLISLCALGCELKPCNEGYEFSKGLCVPKAAGPVDASAPGEGGASGSTDAGPDGATTSGKYAGFGKTCSDDTNHSECTEEANYCGKAMPTDATGRCTRIECLGDLEMCPPDWVCCNIRALVPNSAVGSACIPMKGLPASVAPQCKR